jgi:ABC-type transport system involved in multi-copper enzyme maturation permease subunit
VKIKELFARLNYIQQRTPFKVVASLVLVALGIAAFTAYTVAVTNPAAREAAAMARETEALTRGQSPQDDEEREFLRSIDATQRMLVDIAARRASPANMSIGAAVVAGIGLTAIWLGLGLTYLGLVVVGAVVVLPLWLLGDSSWARQVRWSRTTTLQDVLQSTALLLGGLMALTAAFMATMQGMRALLSAPHPVLAVARNVLVEAVRMKVSLVFIVMLVFALAALPLVLDPTTPLRYRVQSFLQYGTGGTFWIIAVLTLFFAASTVAFEQRDRQIWQTMTKPVGAAQYLLGKWLGVVCLNAVLLAVCCAGVFLFTEYLRKQPADGESKVVSVSEGISKDRMILETQILSARKKVEPDTAKGVHDPEFQEWIKDFIADQRVSDPTFAQDRATFEKVSSDLHKSYTDHFRNLRAGESRIYTFSGLEDAKKRNVPLTLRYRVDSGSNDPTAMYKLTFTFGATILPPQEVGLGHPLTLTLYPSVINDNGRIEMEIVNGALVQMQGGGLAVVPNPDMIVFPAGGLELYYAAGTYQGNFFRVAAVLWVKLAFLAMLAITAATFLSFPVACLIAFSVFLAAEGAGFLKASLEAYSAVAGDEVQWWKVGVRAIGLVVSWMFTSYHELRPTMRLVDGRLLTWGSMAWGTGVLLAWTGALFGLAVAIFRRRELATYSGN